MSEPLEVPGLDAAVESTSDELSFSVCLLGSPQSSLISITHKLHQKTWLDHNQNQNQLTYGADAVAPVSNLPASVLLS